jgi:hypothetical protein
LIEIDGYQIREPVLGDVLGILERGERDGMIAQLMRVCVTRDGVVLGDAVDQVPLAVGLKLVTELVRVSGLSEGNG